MADNSNSEAVAQIAIESPKTKKVKGASNVVKKQRVKPTHPPTSEMVNNAVKSLKERGGSSLQAIKKYLANNYKIDSDKLSPFIKKYLKSAVTNGTLIQTKGKGASGSFKLAAATKSKTVAVEKKIKKLNVSSISKKKSTAVSPKKVIAKKTIKKSIATKTVAAKSPKQKSTKATKSVALKKTPKPKKVAQKKTIAKKIVLKKK